MNRIYIFILLGILAGCTQQPVLYYTFPNELPNKYFVYFDVHGAASLPKDKEGNYFLSFDSTKIFTSTKIEDLDYNYSYYSINQKTDFMERSYIEEKYRIRIIVNIAGKNYTTADHYMIPDHFEITVERELN